MVLPPATSASMEIVKSNKDNDTDETMNVGIEFTLEQWPAHYDEARKAILLELETTETHKLHPIPAYDIQGNLIRLLHYCAKLDVQRVKNNNDFFAADIQTIRVLEEPRSLPSKRKILHPGPSKKIRKEG